MLVTTGCIAGTTRYANRRLPRRSRPPWWPSPLRIPLPMFLKPWRALRRDHDRLVGRDDAAPQLERSPPFLPSLPGPPRLGLWRLEVRDCPSTFMPKVVRQSLSSISRSLPIRQMPALLTRTSAPPPSSFSSLSIPPSTSALEETSPAATAIRRPEVDSSAATRSAAAKSRSNQADVAALRDEARRDTPADAVRCAGDDRTPAFQSVHPQVRGSPTANR